MAVEVRDGSCDNPSFPGPVVVANNHCACSESGHCLFENVTVSNAKGRESSSVQSSRSGDESAAVE